MRINEVHWIREDRSLASGQSARTYEFRFRYRQPLQNGTLKHDGDFMTITFDQPQTGIAAGQFAAWYDGDECVGSGVISD